MTDPTPLRVAFGGRMQVGKTTAADRLVACHGFVKYALADPIKQAARRDFGWDGAKDDRGRRLLQEVGDVGRHYDPDLWLDAFAARLQADRSPRAVVDDVRLPREVDYLRDLGFAVARVVRPAGRIDASRTGRGRRDHATETGLDAADLVEIDNRGTFEELYARLDAWIESLEAERSA